MPNKAVKVLHVLQYSLPTLVGYTIRSNGLLRAQQALGLNVVALTGGLQATEDGAEETINGVRYLRTKRRPEETRPVLRQVKLYRSLARSVAGAIERENPDIVHVHSPAYNALATEWVARRFRKPVVYEMRGLWEDAAVDQKRIREGSLYYRAGRAMETFALRRSHGIVTICQGLRREVRSRGIPDHKIVVVGNGVEASQFQPAPRDQALAESFGFGAAPVFAYIGSLFRYEGVEELLDAIPPFLETVPQARFLILGGGEVEKVVAARAAAIAPAGAVLYRPRVPHHEVAAYYSIADVLIYPRRRNRITDLVTPLKPLEAMAMGKAVLASDCGGHRELVESESNGLLYTAEDRASLVAALCRLAGDVDLRLRLARQAREFILAKRNWPVVARPYLGLYEQLLRPSGNMSE